MSEHINRHAGYSKVTESFGRFLADPNWNLDFDNGSQEEKVLSLLKNKIKARGIAKYLPDFPIYKPNENRVKMRLILGTNSSKGLEVFRNVQYKTEQTELEMRNERNKKSPNQPSLFSDDQIVKLQQKTIGVGCFSNQKEAEQRIFKLLDDQQSILFEDLAIDILEKVSIRMPQLNKLVNKLKKQKRICFELPARRRVPQPNTTIKLIQQFRVNEFFYSSI